MNDDTTSLIALAQQDREVNNSAAGRYLREREAEEKEPSMTLDALKQFGVGAAKGAAEIGRTGVQLTNLALPEERKLPVPTAEEVFEFYGVGLPKPETIAGEISQPFGQFMTALVPAARLAKIVSSGATASVVAGGLADFMAFDPDDGNIASFVDEMGMLPEWGKFLRSEVHEEALVGRLTNVVEGAALGAVFAAGGRGFKGALTAYRERRNEAVGELFEAGMERIKPINQENFDDSNALDVLEGFSETVGARAAQGLSQNKFVAEAMEAGMDRKSAIAIYKHGIQRARGIGIEAQVPTRAKKKEVVGGN